MKMAESEAEMQERTEPRRSTWRATRAWPSVLTDSRRQGLIGAAEQRPQMRPALRDGTGPMLGAGPHRGTPAPQCSCCVVTALECIGV